MKKFQLLMFMLGISLMSATPFTYFEEKELVNLYSKAEMEYWAYLDNIIQQKEAYELYKAEKKVQSTLRLINFKFKNKSFQEQSVVALIKKFSDNVLKTMESLKIPKNRVYKDRGGKFNKYHTFITERHKQLEKIVEIAREVNSTVSEQKEFPVYKKLEKAMKALRHREQLYMVLLRSREKEDDMLEIIRQENVNFSADSMMGEFEMALSKSNNFLSKLPALESDEQIKKTTEEFLEFYKQESHRLLSITKSYFRALKKYRSAKKKMDQIDKSQLKQDEYNAFRTIVNDVVNKQKLWKDEQARQAARRAKLNIDWNKDAVSFMQNWMYKNIPDYKKPDKMSVYSLYN